jgi:hypothetical protein
MVCGLAGPVLGRVNRKFRSSRREILGLVARISGKGARATCPRTAVEEGTRVNVIQVVGFTSRADE